MEAFSHITIGKFQLTLKAEEDLHLPAYKGSTLRGGFGHALKHVTCALKRQECPTCLLRTRCVYLYLFETPPPEDAEMMRLYPEAPHPFVIEPPETDSRTVSKDESLEFCLLLMGRALEYLPYFVYAFAHLGDRGIGRGKGKYTLERISAMNGCDWATIYENGDQVLKQPAIFSTADAICRRCESLASSPELSFRFMTPVRIKFEGHLTNQIEFHHIVRSLLRRVSSVSYFHCGRRLDLDFRGLIDRAQQVKTVSTDLSWHDWERYSSRQKQSMSMGGLVGWVTFAGDFEEFLPLLALGEILHVGKAASFGLGKFILERGITR